MCRISGPILIIVMAIVCSGPLVQRAVAAGGAYMVDDAEINPAGECNLDGWASVGKGGDRIYAAAPSCTFAALPRIEWGLQLAHVSDAGRHETYLGGQAKLALIALDASGVALALTAGLNHALRDDRLAGGFVSLPLTIAWSEDLRSNLNLGWRHDDTAQKDFATWGAGLEWMLSTAVTILGEVFGENEGMPGWQVGPRLTILEGAVDLDLIAGRNLAGLRGHWITLGVAARF